MAFAHTSVLLEQSIAALRIRSDGVYVDGTAGGGGHALEIAKQLTSGKLIALDQDPDAVKAAAKRLEEYPCAVVKQCNFSSIAEVLHEEQIDKIDGLLLDLGVSSHQLDTQQRGFSYHVEAPLDMRMGQVGLSAFDVVNEWSEQEIIQILWRYGEERYARSIAKNICKSRKQQPIETTLQLAALIASSVPAAVRRKKHPAKKSFQAIRIAVNEEMEVLSKTLDTAFSLLAPTGRMAIITFHSLEDRMVKKRFESFCKGCICPPDFPQCVCGQAKKAQLPFRKPVMASDSEIEQNRRSRSAKLRAIEKL